MAEASEANLTSRLDNAGTLQQSVSTSVIHEKISIVCLNHPGHLNQRKVSVLADLKQLPGHEPDYSACTFCLANEDHTLGNALRWIIMKE